MSQSDMRDYIDRAFGGDPDATAPAEPAAVFDDDELEGDETEQEDTEAGGDAEYQELASEFWDSLDPALRASAEQDEVARAELWQQFLEEQGVVAEDEDDQEAEDAGDVEAGGFTSAEELIEAAIANEDALVDGDGRPMKVAAWLNWAASAPEREWVEAARAAGLDPRHRPSYGLISRFGKTLRGAVQQESWKAHLDRVRRSGRYLGQ